MSLLAIQPIGQSSYKRSKELPNIKAKESFGIIPLAPNTNSVSLLPPTGVVKIIPQESQWNSRLVPTESQITGSSPVSLLPSYVSTSIPDLIPTSVSSSMPLSRSPPSLLTSFSDPPRTSTAFTGVTLPRLNSVILPVRFSTVKLYPDQRSSSPSRIYSPEQHGGVLLAGNPLSESQAKFCSCVLKVESKGSAYNPYAVCAKTTGTTMGKAPCTPHYDFDTMPVELLESYLTLHNIPFPLVRDRENMIQAIDQWKSIQGKVSIVRQRVESPRSTTLIESPVSQSFTVGSTKLPLNITQVQSPSRMSGVLSGSTIPSIPIIPTTQTIPIISIGQASLISPIRLNDRSSLLDPTGSISPVSSPRSKISLVGSVSPIGSASPTRFNTIPLNSVPLTLTGFNPTKVVGSSFTNSSILGTRVGSFSQDRTIPLTGKVPLNQIKIIQ